MTMVYFRILIFLCHYIAVFASPLPQYQEEYQGEYEGDYPGEYPYYPDYDPDPYNCELPRELGGIGK